MPYRTLHLILDRIKEVKLTDGIENELAPGVTVEEVKAKTAGKLIVPDHIESVKLD